MNEQIEDVNIPHELGSLDESLRCNICKELLSNAVMISERTCGHSFCSECIRGHFRSQLTSGTVRKTSCPVCRCDVSKRESSLIPNLSLQAAVKGFKDYIQRLSQQCEKEVDYVSETKENDRPRRNTRHAIAAAAKNEEHEQESKFSPHPIPVDKKVKPIYGSLKKKDIMRLCKEEGLATHGDERELKDRHRRFVDMWNGETDSIAPKSAKEIISKFNREENAKCLASSNFSAKQDAQYMSKVKESRKQSGLNDSTKVSSGNPQFDETLNTGFAKLIAKEKERRRNESSKANGIEDTPVRAKSENADASLGASPTITGNDAINMTSDEIKDEGHPENTNEASFGVAFESSTVQNTHVEVASVTATSESNSFVDLTDSVAHSTGSASSLSPTDITTSSDARASQGQRTIDQTMKVQTKKRSSPTSFSSANSLSKTRHRRFRSTNEPWNCHACTYLNKSQHTKTTCVMCGTQRQV